MKIAEIQGLTYSVHSRRVLKDVSLSVEQGEFLVLLGSAQSGKSELVRCLNALVRPESGCVTVCGIDATEPKNTNALREKCAMVFGGAREHFVCRTVREETAFALRCFGKAADAVPTALEKVAYRGREDAALCELTPLDAVRVSVAAAIATEPELVIFDNILSPLSASDRRELRGLIRKLHGDGMSVILTSDNAEDAADADRVVVLREGEVLSDGNRQEVFSDKTIFETAGLAVPFAVRAYFDLLDADVSLSRIPLTEDELVEEVCR